MEQEAGQLGSRTNRENNTQMLSHCILQWMLIWNFNKKNCENNAPFWRKMEKCREGEAWEEEEVKREMRRRWEEEKRENKARGRGGEAGRRKSSGDHLPYLMDFLLIEPIGSLYSDLYNTHTLTEIDFSNQYVRLFFLLNISFKIIITSFGKYHKKELMHWV